MLKLSERLGRRSAPNCSRDRASSTAFEGAICCVGETELAMRWPSLWSSPKDDKADQASPVQPPGEVLDDLLETLNPSISNTTPSNPTSSRSFDWNWHSYTEPQTVISTIALTSACIGFYKFYRTFLRRIPAAVNVSPSFFRKRSVFGQVTSVGDGDNFRIFHTPGGRLAGWDWWRPIPKDKKALKNNTVLISMRSVVFQRLWADVIAHLDSRSTSWDRRAGSCPLRPTCPALFPGST